MLLSTLVIPVNKSMTIKKKKVTLGSWKIIVKGYINDDLPGQKSNKSWNLRHYH